jgi:hypothetical protein
MAAHHRETPTGTVYAYLLDKMNMLSCAPPYIALAQNCAQRLTNGEVAAYQKGLSSTVSAAIWVEASEPPLVCCTTFSGDSTGFAAASTTASMRY